jgi:hypothetical protein
MEMNVENTKVMRISRDPSPVQIITDQKQLGNAEFFYSGSLRGSDARCTHEINYILECNGKSNVLQEVNAFHQQTVLVFKKNN